MPTELVDLCTVSGVVLVSIDYRKAPAVQLPAIIRDVEDAFAWIREEGPILFRADADRLVVAGASAGAYLAMVSGFRIHPRPTAIVSYSGYGSEEREAWTDGVSGFDPVTDLDQFSAYLPLYNVTPAYPPILMIHGTEDHDVPYSEAVDMAQVLAVHHVPHELILLPGSDHWRSGGDPELEDVAENRAIAFINRHLAGNATEAEIAPLLQAFTSLREGRRLARAGRVSEARQSYAEALALEPRITVSAWDWRDLCWFGSLWGHANEVMAACVQAVDLARGSEQTGWALESRAVARAVSGQLGAARDDLEASVASSEIDTPQRKKRERWLSALRMGNNPFTPDVLESLRKAGSE